MTTILSCEAPDWVVLASDRAISYADSSGHAQPSPDRAVKTVLLYSSFLVGITGVAELEGEPIDEWVLTALKSTEPSIWPSTLATRATSALERIPTSWRNKPLTFAAVGLAPSSPGGIVETRHIVVSNVLTPSGSRAKPSRQVSPFRLPPLGKQPVRVRAYGQAPKPGGIRWAERALRRYAERYPGRPQGAVQLLGRMISGISNFSPTVSSACLVCVLPRPAFGASNVDTVIGTDSHVSDDAITCINYIGNEDQRIAYTPPFLWPGGAMGKGGFFGPAAETPQGPFLHRPGPT